MLYFVFVTPEHFKDLIKYFTEVRSIFESLTDEDAIQFSSNGQFLVHGLCYDRPDVLYKKL